MVGPVSGTVPGQRTSGGAPLDPKPRAELPPAPAVPFTPAPPATPAVSAGPVLPPPTGTPLALPPGSVADPLQAADTLAPPAAAPVAPGAPAAPAAEDAPTATLPRIGVTAPGQAYETQEILLPRRSQTRVQTTEAPERDRVVYLVAFAAALLSAAAVFHFASRHEILGYHDGYSHLEISRRILASRTTGIAQLGTIWLPLPHVLQSLFAWNWTLYSTGLAGSLVSGGCFVGGATYVYKIVRELCDGRKLPGVIGATVFMTNANMLFHQSTPMDELPFYVCVLAVVFHLIRWASTKRAVDLLSAAIANFLAMLCRYEAWMLAGVFAVCVVVMARRLGHSWRDVRGLTSVWVSFGGAAASLGWCAYNWMVTGNALNFIDGPDSSADQMSRRHDVEVGNWGRSIKAYAQAVGADLGLAVVVLALAALVLLIARERFSARTMPIFALLTVMPFFVYSLESGQVPIGMPPVNADILNGRFGLVALLPASMVIGYAAGMLLPRRVVAPTAVLTAVALLGVTGYSYQHKQVVLLKESVEDNSAQQSQADVGSFISAHTTGPILVNLVGNERVAFPNLNRVVYEGTKDKAGNVWTRALADPRSVGARVIVMRHSATRGTDKVYDALKNWTGLSAYRVVFSNAEYTVYSISGD